MKQNCVLEFFGVTFLVMIVVGSGIMGERLSNGNMAIALLANSFATGLGIFVLIQTLGSVFDAHINPVVSLVEALNGRIGRKNLLKYWCVQFVGGALGVILAHAMFGEAIFQISLNNRNSTNLFLSEIIATFGLICTISLSKRRNLDCVAVATAAYVASAYWFTSSTSFANPAVTVSRMFTNTFCGISPSGVVSFIFAQLIGAGLAYLGLQRIQNFLIVTQDDL